MLPLLSVEVVGQQREREREREILLRDEKTAADERQWEDANYTRLDCVSGWGT